MCIFDKRFITLRLIDVETEKSEGQDFLLLEDVNVISRSFKFLCNKYRQEYSTGFLKAIKDRFAKKSVGEVQLISRMLIRYGGHYVVQVLADFNLLLKQILGRNKG